MLEESLETSTIVPVEIVLLKFYAEKHAKIDTTIILGRKRR